MGVARTFSLPAAATAFFLATTAAGQSGGDRVAAESVFQDGRRLMAEGKYAQACPKFEVSQRLDPGVGTLLNLADCYEKSGRTASAWAMFLEAASGARAAGNAAREQAARDRASALAGKLPRLTINVASHEVPGLSVKRDGTAVDRALWGTSVPVDPGDRTIEVTAPGKRKWSTTVQVRGDKSNVVVDVPELPSESGPGAAPDASSTAESRTGPNLAAWGLLGVGAAGVVVGTVFGVSAKSKWEEARSHCVVGNACRAEALPIADDAKKSAAISTVAFIAGGAGLAAGTILLFTSRRSTNAATLEVRTSIDPLHGGIRLEGTF